MYELEGWLIGWKGQWIATHLESGRYVTGLTQEELVAKLEPLLD